MAHVLDVKYQLDTLGTTLYVTDITGQYEATDNPGGWGAPNPELDQSALVALVRRVVDEDKSTLTSISNQVVYDPTAANTKETQFTFNTGTDGHIEIVLFRLPVSLDGVNNLEGDTLANGDFFYWSNNSNLLWEMVAGVPTEITAEDLFEEASVTQILCEDLIFPQLAIKYNSLYRTYFEGRSTGCTTSDDLFDEIMRLRVDLYGAKTAFRSGLKVKAEEIIDTLLRKYDLLVE